MTVSRWVPRLGILCFPSETVISASVAARTRFPAVMAPVTAAGGSPSAVALRGSVSTAGTVFRWPAPAVRVVVRRLAR
jgi:hypothetical protein